MELGFGYNPLTGEVSTNWVDFGEHSPAGGQTGQTAELLFKRVASSAELSQVLGLDAEINLSASWFRAGGSLKAQVFAESSRKINEYSTLSVLYVKVRGMAQNLRNVDLKPSSVDFINSWDRNKGLDEFFRKAGYEYISGIIPGGEFISTIEIISNDIETKERIDAALNAQISFSTPIPKIGAIEANAELKSTFAELAKYNNVRIEARCYRKGGVGEMVISPEAALQYAVDFPASVQKSADILQVICMPYHKLISFPKRFDVREVERQQRELKILWDRYQQVTKSIADVDYTLQYPMQFDGGNEDILRNRLQQLEKQLEAISETAKDYAQNPKTVRINEREFAPISLDLPPRKQEPKSLPKQQPVQQHPVDAIALESENGVDYRNLRDLLKAGKWREADEETQKVMQKASNDRFLSNVSLKNFPCKDLMTIDRLWVTASKGHFGFSVQKKIWEECGSPSWDVPRNDVNMLINFGTRVGWVNRGWLIYNVLSYDYDVLNYDNLKFDINFSPNGELPAYSFCWNRDNRCKFLIEGIFYCINGCGL
jgi:GUN4-like